MIASKVMATKNIEININNGNGYDVLYPKTDVGLVANAVSISQFNNLNGTVNSLNSQIGGINNSINTIKGQLGNFRTQIVTYTGNGQCGEAQKTTLTFNFSPQLIAIYSGEGVYGIATGVPSNNTLNSRFSQWPFTQMYAFFINFPNTDVEMSDSIVVAVFYSGTFNNNATVYTTYYEVVGNQFRCWVNKKNSSSPGSDTAQYKSAAQFNEDAVPYTAVGYRWT